MTDKSRQTSTGQARVQHLLGGVSQSPTARPDLEQVGRSHPVRTGRRRRRPARRSGNRAGDAVFGDLPSAGRSQREDGHPNISITRTRRPSGYRVGRAWRMTREDVVDLIERHRNRSRARNDVEVQRINASGLTSTSRRRRERGVCSRRGGVGHQCRRVGSSWIMTIIHQHPSIHVHNLFHYLWHAQDVFGCVLVLVLAVDDGRGQAGHHHVRQPLRAHSLSTQGSFAAAALCGQIC